MLYDKINTISFAASSQEISEGQIISLTQRDSEKLSNFLI